MNSYARRVERAAAALRDAEYILIGGGAGLSDAAGLKYSGATFNESFREYIEKYGFEDLYTSSFYPFETQEERWAYWAKHISFSRYEPPAAELYKRLSGLVKNRRYFVITTNAEHQFIKAGFPEEKVFAVQGNYAFFQCETGCHDKLYYNEEVVKEMLENTADCRIPTSLVPKCPVCGGDIDINLRHNEFFVQDDAWYRQAQRYSDFVDWCSGKKTVYLELGVGYNTPVIIRIPFEQLTYNSSKATLIRLNRDYPACAKGNEAKTISFTENMSEVLEDFMKGVTNR